MATLAFDEPVTKAPTGTLVFDKTPDVPEPLPPAIATEPPEPQANTYLTDKNLVVQHSADLSHDQVRHQIGQTIYNEPPIRSYDDSPAASTGIFNAFTDGLKHNNPKLLANLGPPEDVKSADKKLNTNAPFNPAEYSPLPTISMPAAKEIGKAPILGIEDVARGLSGLMKWTSDIMTSHPEAIQNPGMSEIAADLVTRHQPDMGDLEFTREVGKSFGDLHEKIADFIKDRQTKGWEAPDPELMQGSFLSNPSFLRVAATLTRQVPFLAATTLATIAAGPEVAAGAIGLYSAGEQYASSREHGGSIQRASSTALGSGLGNAFLMELPLGKAIEGKLGGKLKGAATFAGTNAILNPFNNIIAKLGGDKSRRLFEGMFESTLMASLTGGMWGHFMPDKAAEIDQLVQDHHKAGGSARDIDQARAVVGNELAKEWPALEKIIEKYGKRGIPKREPNEIVSTVTSQEGVKTEITHKEVVDLAEYNLQIQKEKYDAQSNLEQYALKNKIKPNPPDETGKIPEHEEYKSIPNRFKNKNGNYLDAVAENYGMSDNEYREGLKEIGDRGKPPKLDYFGALRELEHEGENPSLPEEGNADFGYGDEKTPERAAEQRADFFSQSPDNVVDRYQRLIDQATSQGLNPLQAQKWAKEQLRTNPEAGLPELKPKQGEFGVEGGVEGFGQGKKGERSLFERPLEVAEPNKDNKYVRNEPFELDFEPESDKHTAGDIRQQFSEIKNASVVRTNQFGESAERAVKSESEREGMAWYMDANGDMGKLAELLDDPRMSFYHDQILRAMNLSPEALKKINDIRQFYQEAGRVSQEIGTIKTLRENYFNRIAEPEPPKDFVKTDKKSGLPQTTSHGKQRVYETMAERVQDSGKNGKVFATTDIAKLVRIYGEEMAWVNTSRKLADAMVANGLGAWTKEPPAGWTKVGNIQKSQKFVDGNGNAQIASKSFVAPEGIAKGLEAITDPNWANKIDVLRGIQKYQGLVKTFDLSLSLFHHFTFAMQTINSGGIRALFEAGKMKEIMAHPDFNKNEVAFVEHGGIVSTILQNQDVMRSLVDNSGDTFSKITNLPGVKQSLSGIERSGDFLFDHVQRYLKVTSWGSKMSNWMAENPNASNAEVKAAGRGFAEAVNNVYGGQNWEAMGMTKSNLTLLRLGMLAPDYFISNAKYMRGVFKGGTEGIATRGNLMTAMAVGMIATEGLNKIMTGHFTDQNKKGHELEVEIAPNVYVNFFRGGPGEIVKIASMVRESGPYVGLSRYSQGKLAPAARTAVGLLARTDYSGKSIKTTYEALKFILGSIGPVPFSITNLGGYLKNEPNKTAAGTAAVATGIGRYSKGQKSSNFKL